MTNPLYIRGEGDGRYENGIRIDGQRLFIKKKKKKKKKVGVGHSYRPSRRRPKTAQKTR